MPELPEVEHVVRGLQPCVGDCIAKLVSGAHQPPDDLADVERQIAGRSIKAITRRGKWILMDIGDAVLVVHLRMTGSFRVSDLTNTRTALPRHGRWSLITDRRELAMIDPRGFATLQLLANENVQAFFDARLGLEPIDVGFDGEYLADKAVRRGRSQIKAFLLDQKVAAGAGNIYVDEALFAARIHPQAKVGSLTRTELATLAAALSEKIQLGLRSGGASVRNYQHTDGSEGSMQLMLAAYGRAGQPCIRCKTTLVRGTVAGRGTVWCPFCQVQKDTQ